MEERYGRNLKANFADKAKIAVRKRIASLMSEQLKQSATEGELVTEEDVYLFPCGMSAIFNTHRLMLEAFSNRKSVCFGFPYLDTLKILQKFGPGCYFLGHGDSADIDRLEQILDKHLRERDPILALFCEFPSNPLLKSPDLKRLRFLADKHGFMIVVDETIGNFVNVQVLQWADVIVSSLTKVFSGDSNVMGGSLVLNPRRAFYQTLKEVLSRSYEDLLWCEDAIYLERNSRTFRDRIKTIDENAETICDFLKNHPKVVQVFYPKFSTPSNYRTYKTPTGGYGGLFSMVLASEEGAAQFFDRLPCAKGPSLGTNFTLACPYTILAHYSELEWAEQYGVSKNLVRVSVGLECKEQLLSTFRSALDAVGS
jgi:cystathionine gamma-synthase